MTINQKVMKTITLRRAAKLRNRLGERLSELKRELNRVTVDVNVFDTNISTQLDTKSEQFRANLTRYEAVSTVLADLRSRIDNVNVANDVNALLARQAALKGKILTYMSLSNSRESRLSADLVDSRIAGARQRAEKSEYGHESVSFSILPQEVIDDARVKVQSIQTELDEIQDELERINSSNTVELTDIILAVLQLERLN